MPSGRRLTPEQLAKGRDIYERTGNLALAARSVPCDRGALGRHILMQRAEQGGQAPAPAPSCEPQPAPAPAAPAAQPEPRFDLATKALRKGPLTLDQVAHVAGCSRGAALDWIDGLKAGSTNVHQVGDRYAIETRPEPASVAGLVTEYVSRPDNTFVFGALGDTHLASKYERLDVLDDLYDAFAAARVDRVFHTGNWIEGEAPFNRFDVAVHGLDGQLAYLAEHYPRREGLHTYAIHGDDHEGWYGQREGLDVGHHAENILRDHGRDDWHNLGFIEAHVRLINANTGKVATLAVIHPGGGSAYALSYTVQKIVESMEGGEKPAVLLVGHYHKMEALNVRNIWALQTGCTQDQTPFMRKKRLEAHVGGSIVTLEQDPETGAITRFVPDMRRYFNRGYYNGRWSKAGAVTLPDRRITP